MRNWNRVALVYRWLEYLAFGAALEHCRTHFLPSLLKRKNALLLGEGDGRFLAEYLRVNSTGLVDTIDVSASMQRLAEKRTAAVAGGQLRVRFVTADAQTYQPSTSYDLFVTHFFLDCLAAPEIDALAAKLRRAAEPRACWIVSEFCYAEGGLFGLLCRALIRVMYAFFNLTTGLRVTRISNHAPILKRNGFRLETRELRLGGLLAAELWNVSEES